MISARINGGNPVFDNPIRYGHQWISDDDVRAVNSVIQSDFLTCGPKVEELERTLESMIGVKHAVVVSSGTAALHCACMAAGIGIGDEVITTPLTFAASANCVLYCGGRPVFADVRDNTYNINPDCIESLITSKTKAVIAVDYTGQCVEIDKIKKICNERGLIFIEDAAHSIGTKYNGKNIGTLADLTCFSFHPVKTVTGGEGGAVLTNSDELYEKLELISKHGITHNHERMTLGDDAPPWYYEQVVLGYNYRMTDFQAALLISQLKRLNFFSSRRKIITERYNTAFEKMPELIVQDEIPESDTCRHLYILRINLRTLNCDRQTFFKSMRAENILCQVHYIPVYWFPYYQRLGYKRGICPIAEKIYESIMSIPLYPKMTDEDVNKVIYAVEQICKYYSKEIGG